MTSCLTESVWATTRTKSNRKEPRGKAWGKLKRDNHCPSLNPSSLTVSTAPCVIAAWSQPSERQLREE